jgi:hypothetical protein
LARARTDQPPRLCGQHQPGVGERRASTRQTTTIRATRQHEGQHRDAQGRVNRQSDRMGQPGRQQHATHTDRTDQRPDEQGDSQRLKQVIRIHRAPWRMLDRRLPGDPD